MVGSYRIQFINKSSRPNSQELSPEDQAPKSITNHSNNSMDSVYIYTAAGPAPAKMVKRRESRIRTSFFGSGRRGSCDLAPEDVEPAGMKSPSRSMTSSTASDDKENSSFLNRRKLRKSTSHASLASISTAYEAQRQEKLGRRGFTDLLRGNGGKQTPPIRPSIGSRKLTHPISKPFNFSHVTHTNSTTFGQIQQTEDSVLVQDWHKAVRESRMPGSRRKTESTVVVTPATVAALQRTTSIRSRKRANTNLTISPRDSIDLGQPSPTLSDENTIHTCPRTPPPRITSKHGLRSLVEDPVAEDNECVFRPGRDSVFLLGGRKTSVKVVREQMSDSDSSNSSTIDEYDEGISELRSSKSTPDLLALRRNSYLMGRPVSQIGVFDDSTAPPPQASNRMSMAGRRISKRFSIRPDALAQDVGAFLDSWEEDIDWCYENEVDEIEWDTPDYGMTPAPSCESLPIDNDMLKVPEVKDEFILVEKRITGVFEDKLLLPPSPQLTSFPDSTIGIADGGFEQYEPESEDIIFRAASTALRHRSISSAASLPDLIHSRPSRDELNRVAQQLDDHIAALNQETYSIRPISTNTRDPHAFYLGNRSRAYSEATCVTLCSDSTETGTPACADEIPTPNSSAHNSFQFTGRDDGRAEKGLSFPAAALPGVIEFAPDGLHHIAADEQEFVHFI